LNSRRAELVLSALLLLAAVFAVGFVAVYAIGSAPDPTQLLGLSLGLTFVCLAGACLVIARRLVPDEELEDDYPAYEDEGAQIQLEALVAESTSRFTRRRLVVGSASVAGLAVAAAAAAPLTAFGPVFDLQSFVQTPWRRGRVLVGEDGRPLAADDIDEADFYSAYPQGADREQYGAPLVVVRLPPAQIHPPPGREGWQPDGILAYSKICTHAGCAISLYRTPRFPAVDPAPALVCPCHYSTFDPARGAKVLFGPAGRPLPQLPLELGPGGELRAAGNFSGPVGPAWWGVRSRRPA
jgi:ubiquinol-cytochrome c reductase iron-sulfur subunit